MENTEIDVTWLPKSNRVRSLIMDAPPEAKLTTCVFGLFFDDKGRLLCSRMHDRGVDVVGGHIESGEDCQTALRRETLEETGARVGELTFVGVRELLVPEPPEGYTYPTPLSYHGVYAGRVEHMGSVLCVEECGEPCFLTQAEINSTWAIKRFQVLIDKARLVLRLAGA